MVSREAVQPVPLIVSQGRDGESPGKRVRRRPGLCPKTAASAAFAVLQRVGFVVEWEATTRPDYRLFDCARCHRRISLCSHCDRGQRYCRACAPVARRKSTRAAGYRYQRTRRGRHCHAARQARYRSRQRERAEKVTHRGTPEGVARTTLDRVGRSTREPLYDPRNPRCMQCGESCRGFVRTSFRRCRRR